MKTMQSGDSGSFQKVSDIGMPRNLRMGIVGKSKIPPLRHWKVVLDEDAQFFHGYVSGNIKHEPASNKLFHKLLDECIANGWVWPKVKNGVLSFGSYYPENQRPTDPMAPEPDFEHEE